MKEKYFYGYNIVAAGALTQAVCIGAMFTFGVFFKEFEATFGWSRALVSGASSLAFFVMGAGGIAAGILNDRMGPRLLLTVSGISMGFGYILLSQMNKPWQLYLLYGLMVGIGLSTHDVLTLSTVARWFVKRRGLMSGIVKVGTGFGQLVVPMIGTALIAAYGWRSAYMIIGAAVLAGLVLSAQFMKRDPGELGLKPDGGLGGADGSQSGQPETDLSFKEARRTRPFWILCLAEFTIFFCLLTIVVHIVPFGRDQGLSAGTASGVLATLGGVSMLGRAGMGGIIDRIGGKKSLLVCFIILLASLCWLQLSSQAWMLYVFALFYGFTHGGFFTVMSPTVAELFGTRSHGTLFGLILFCGTLGGSVGPLLTGYLFDVTDSYRLAFVLLMALAFIGFVLIAFLRSPTPVDATNPSTLS